MQNPYTLTFGKEPIEYIKRIAEERQILEDFLSPNPPQQVYMISGVRGCGKTVFMTDISQESNEGPNKAPLHTCFYQACT